jgi:hypothetical protein
MNTMSIELKVFSIARRWTQEELHRAQGTSFGEVIAEAVESGANLRDADLRDANLRDANLRGANLRGVKIPLVESLDRKMLEAVLRPGALEMGSWHSCATTHCRAGWAITLAGEDGANLERQVGPSAAGALIYHASAGYVPDFHASNKDAMEDIKKRAEAPER